MPIQRTPVRTPTDTRRMQELAVTHPARTVHVTDLSYRLASPALHDDPERDTALWVDGGALLAWAVWQSPWGKLDYAVRPTHAAELGPDIVERAEARMRELAGERNTPIVCSVSARANVWRPRGAAGRGRLPAR